jgi:hypothetical protein
MRTVKRPNLRKRLYKENVSSNRPTGGHKGSIENNQEKWIELQLFSEDSIHLYYIHKRSNVISNDLLLLVIRQVYTLV